MENYKNILQEYTMKRSLPMPVYESVNEGPDHLPQFACHVTVNGVRYPSLTVHIHKKQAEQSAAKLAIETLASDAAAYRFEETLGKTLLLELLVKLGTIDSPTKFVTTKTGSAHAPTFISSVEVNGASYIGGAAKTKKEAEAKAAFQAYQAIKAQLGEGVFQEQPIPVCKDAKSEVMAITNECTPTNSVLVGTNSVQLVTDLKNVKVENPFAGEMGFGKSNENEAGSAYITLPHIQLEQEASLVQQTEVKTGRGVAQHQEHGPIMTEEKQQCELEANLRESINKRSRNELEISEQMGKKKKKNKKNKIKSINSSGPSTDN